MSVTNAIALSPDLWTYSEILVRAPVAVPAAWTVKRWGGRSFTVNVGVLIDTRARQALIVDHMHPTAGAILIDIPAACKLVVCGTIKDGTQYMAVALKGYDQPAGLHLPAPA